MKTWLSYHCLTNRHFHLTAKPKDCKLKQWQSIVRLHKKLLGQFWFKCPWVWIKRKRTVELSEKKNVFNLTKAKRNNLDFCFFPRSLQSFANELKPHFLHCHFSYYFFTSTVASGVPSPIFKCSIPETYRRTAVPYSRTHRCYKSTGRLHSRNIRICTWQRRMCKVRLNRHWRYQNSHSEVLHISLKKMHTQCLQPVR